VFADSLEKYFLISQMLDPIFGRNAYIELQNSETEILGQKESNLYAYMVSFSAAMGGLLFGYEVGVISQVLSMTSFQLYFGILDSNLKRTLNAASVEGMVTFTFLSGCTLGAMLASYVTNQYGRKLPIVLSGILFLIGAIFQSSSTTIRLFFAGRFFSGLSIGVLSMAVPLFISETAKSEIRGRMIAIQQLMITIGILIASIVNAFIIKHQQKDNRNDFEWKLCLGMQIIPALLLVLSTYSIPESPRWLASKDQNSKCFAILSKLRSLPKTNQLLKSEYQEIIDQVVIEKSLGTGQWTELLSKGMYNRFIRACLVQAFQQWTGINVILYYQSTLLQGMGLDKDAATIPFTIANNFVNVIATFPGMYFIEVYGRRKLLIAGGIGMGVAHYLVCVFIKLGEAGFKYCYYLAIISVYLFLISFASTWGPIGNLN
jgi:sugar porter (SP) family MFS transporter